MRLEAEVGHRRWLRYRARVRPALLGFAAGTGDTPPAPPAGRFQRRAMRQLILGLGPLVRGDASGRLAALFRSYGLVAPALRDLRARQVRTRIRAAEALGAMGVVEAVPHLRASLTSDEWLLRFACARALADLGALEALDDVIAALADSEAQLGATSDILLAFGPEATGFLCAHVRSASSERERWLAAHTLGQMRSFAAIDELRSAVSSSDPELAVRAARGLGWIGGGAAATELAAAAQGEQSWFVRAAAARALGKLGDPRAAVVLTAILATADRWEVRDSAAGALVELGEPALDVVAVRLGVLPDVAVAHYAGALDVADVLGAVVDRASAGEPCPDALVRRACAAGIRARLEEAAGGPVGRARTYARELLRA